MKFVFGIVSNTVSIITIYKFNRSIRLKQPDQPDRSIQINHTKATRTTILKQPDKPCKNPDQPDRSIQINQTKAS